MSLINQEYDETYSVGEPYEHAMKYYARHVKDGDSILDIGFGLGYTTASCLYRNKKLRIVCLEKDRKILGQIRTLEVDKRLKTFYPYIMRLISGLNYKNEDYDLKLIIGDARLSIKKLKEKFDVVFLDGFSVFKNPELWSFDFINEIKKLLKEDGKILSYSNSVIFRKNLMEAGFKVGYNNEGTWASLKEDLRLDEKDLKLINAFGVVLRDNGLRSSREELIEQIKKLLYF